MLMAARFRMGMIAGAALLGPTLLTASADPPAPPRVVEAEQFILRDARGTRRSRLAVVDGIPSLTLFDGKGKPRVVLELLADDTARLTYHDVNGKGHGTIHIGPTGEPRLELPATGPALKNEPAPEKGTVVRPAAHDPEEARKVEPLYRQYCVSCHAAKGDGTRVRNKMPSIPDFTSGKWLAGRSDAQILTSILEGRGKDMPPFSTELTAEQARQMVALIRSFGPETVRPVDSPLADFDQRLRQLQKQWEELDRQYQAISSPNGGR